MTWNRRAKACRGLFCGKTAVKRSRRELLDVVNDGLSGCKGAARIRRTPALAQRRHAKDSGRGLPYLILSLRRGGLVTSAGDPGVEAFVPRPFVPKPIFFASSRRVSA